MPQPASLIYAASDRPSRRAPWRRALKLVTLVVMPLLMIASTILGAHFLGFAAVALLCVL
jgi:hypothetical protein